MELRDDGGGEPTHAKTVREQLSVETKSNGSPSNSVADRKEAHSSDGDPGARGVALKSADCEGKSAVSVCSRCQ